MNRMVMSGGGVGRDGKGLFTAKINMRLQDLMFKLKLTRILAQSSVSGRGWWRDDGGAGEWEWELGTGFLAERKTSGS